MELESPPGPITILPEGIGASGRPLYDGDSDYVTIKGHMSARYIHLLAQPNVAG